MNVSLPSSPGASFRRAVAHALVKPTSTVVSLGLALGLVLASGCATTSGMPKTTAAPDAPIIEKLVVTGASAVSSGDIEEKILSSQTSAFDFLPFVEEKRFDSIAWQADLRRIERYYHSRGYYSARIVSSDVQSSPDGKRVTLNVTVVEGSPTLVERIEVRGLEDLPENHRKQVMDGFPFKTKEVFEEERWDGLKEALRRKLLELGYAQAEVDGEVSVDVGTREAAIRMQVEHGKRFRFGTVFVAPYPRAQVRREWILQQARESIREGEWYTETALADAQSRIFGMGVFGAVRVTASTPDPETGVVPVVVDVREAPFRTIRAGGGAAVDPLRYEGRVLSEYTHRNFFGGLRRVTVGGRAGYAYLPNGATPKTGPIARITGEFEQPRFFAPTLAARTSVQLERGLEPAYDYYGGKLKAGVVWRPFPYVSVYPSYNYERYALTGTVEVGGRTPELTFGCRQGEACLLSLSYLEQLIEWDRRDHPLEPKKGHYLSVAFQEGGGLLGGNFTYFRILPEARYYKSFGLRQDFTLAMRLRVGTLLPRATTVNGERRVSDSPIVARFFGGGAMAMRGFSERRLSPMQAVTQNKYPEDGIAGPIGMQQGAVVPIGGNGLVESSIETRYNLLGDLVLATFLDSGVVTRESLRVKDPRSLWDSLMHAVGFGLRYRTLVGPIRLDLAYRLPFGSPLPVDQPPAPRDNVLVNAPWRCFTGLFGATPRNYAGFPEGPCTLHLSIGEAF